MYAELHALSNFSFLRGASHPEELVAQAKDLNYRGLALTDECSLAGVVRAHVAAKEHGLPLIIGTELNCLDGLKLVALATDRASYGAMSRLISRARRASAKGSYALARTDLENALDGCLIIWLPRTGRVLAPGQEADGRWLRERFAGRLWIGVELLTGGFDTRRLELLETLGKTLELPRVAAGDVHMHRRSRRALQDVLTAIRLNTPLQAAGYAVFPNGERCLRPLQRLRELYPAPLLAQTLEIAERCTFKLDELRYEYPEEIVPAGATPTSHLRELTEQGCSAAMAGGRAAGRAREHRTRIAFDRRAQIRAVLSDRARRRSSMRARREYSARAAVPRPTPPSVIACGSPKWILRAWPCCSSASFPRSATSRPISTWISSTSGAKR